MDNIHEAPERPAGTSAAAGLRRLQKAASEGNEKAQAELAEAVGGKKSVHAACVGAGLRKATRVDSDLKQRAARALAEWIVEHANGNDLAGDAHSPDAHETACRGCTGGPFSFRC